MNNLQPQTRSLWNRISNRIIGGFFLIIPIVMTCWIVFFLYRILTNWAARILDSRLFSSIKDISGVETLTRLFSLFLIFVLLFSIGTVAKYAIGRRFFSMLERVVLRIPMLNTLYFTAQQIIDAIRNPGSGMFRKVVLFEYPRKGLYVIGFLTNENSNDWELSQKTGRDLISVFLPTTPNPTSGFLLFIPREDCIFLEMGVSQGMRLVISGGAVGAIKLPGHNHTDEEYSQAKQETEL